MASKKLLTPLVFSLFGIKHKKRRKEERPLLTTFSNTGSSRKVTAYILGACDLDRAPGFISNMGGLLCTQATLARRRCLGTSNLLQQGGGITPDTGSRNWSCRHTEESNGCSAVYSDGASSGALAPPLPILGTWSPPKPSLKILCIYVLGRRG